MFDLSLVVCVSFSRRKVLIVSVTKIVVPIVAVSDMGHAHNRHFVF